MSDSVFSDFRFNDFDDLTFIREEREEAAKPMKKDRKLFLVKCLVAVLVLVLLIEGIISTVVLPCLGPVKVECYGQVLLTEEYILSRVAAVENENFIHFNTTKASRAVSDIPCIDEVYVQKHFPDRIVINVKERVPVAKTIAEVNGHAMSVQIDKNGVLFTSPSTTVVQDSSIPLITGLPTTGLAEAYRLPERFRGLMDRIQTIARSNQNYFAAVSEIRVVQKEYGNYELVLYPIHRHIKVLCDSMLDKAALDYMIVTLDVVERLRFDVTEVDLRYGAVSYRVKDSSVITEEQKSELQDAVNQAYNAFAADSEMFTEDQVMGTSL